MFLFRTRSVLNKEKLGNWGRGKKESNTNSLVPYCFSTLTFKCMKHSSIRSWKGRRFSETLLSWILIPAPRKGILGGTKEEKRWDFSRGSNNLPGSAGIIWEINCKTLPVTGTWICPLIPAWSSKYKMEKAHGKWVFPVNFWKMLAAHRGSLISSMYFNVMGFVQNTFSCPSATNLS